jgi:CO/xanthine dehydrogenase Mo-binding subunit
MGGRQVVLIGAADIGTGTWTTLTQIAAAYVVNVTSGVG